ncbi:YeiH family protein [Paenibacillus endoradicis]|uniref:YeiH family protein n=1 Tax=Paenibacillus endoradicis TaxID=2972487 RepID=UPI002159B2F7|nr:putative sulfate exporter family transporter [Paenibacillus endoradicis]MCR8658984.1 putative sulfate exporter family transporter [Paenibacillus endoradicis]
MTTRKLYGILLPTSLAMVAYAFSFLPVLSLVGPLPIAILLAVLFRNFIYNAAKWQDGIDFSSKIILRIAIVLYGVRLNIILLFQEGLSLIGAAAIVIACTFTIVLLLAKWLKVEQSIALLLATGTAICGAAAIGAVSPIIKSNKNDIALSAALIAIVGTLFALGAPLAEQWIHLSPEQYGTWVGYSTHEIAHAALAGDYFGNESLTNAFMAKLSRVFLLFPVTIIFTWWMNRKNEGVTAKASFPYFIIGFIIISLISTAGFYVGFMNEGIQTNISSFATFLLAVSMAALGLSIDLRSIKKTAAKPLLLLVIASICVYGITLLLV